MKNFGGKKASKKRLRIKHALLYRLAEREWVVLSAKDMGLSSLESSKPRSTAANLVGCTKQVFSRGHVDSRSWLSGSEWTSFARQSMQTMVIQKYWWQTSKNRLLSQLEGPLDERVYETQMLFNKRHVRGWSPPPSPKPRQRAEVGAERLKVKSYFIMVWWMSCSKRRRTRLYLAMNRTQDAASAWILDDWWSVGFRLNWETLRRRPGRRFIITA